MSLGTSDGKTARRRERLDILVVADLETLFDDQDGIDLDGAGTSLALDQRGLVHTLTRGRSLDGGMGCRVTVHVGEYLRWRVALADINSQALIRGVTSADGQVVAADAWATHMVRRQALARRDDPYQVETCQEILERVWRCRALTAGKTRVSIEFVAFDRDLSEIGVFSIQADVIVLDADDDGGDEDQA